MALMAQFPAKSMALSKVIKRGNKTIEELQKEHEELSPDLQKCSTDKIDSIKAIHCVVEGIKQTFVAFHGALQVPSFSVSVILRHTSDQVVS